MRQYLGSTRAQGRYRGWDSNDWSKNNQSESLVWSHFRDVKQIFSFFLFFLPEKNQKLAQNDCRSTVISVSEKLRSVWKVFLHPSTSTLQILKWRCDSGAAGYSEQRSAPHAQHTRGSEGTAFCSKQTLCSSHRHGYRSSKNINSDNKRPDRQAAFYRCSLAEKRFPQLC